ncbi:MAG TPA: hypothetical protein VES65_00310 [Solirubrobacteraceae bacterium]|nr:hypothetical protein [Solirubrobacteraceae bacterium]
MSEFIASLKSDLLDRRFLPLLVLLGACLLGALAYAILGGGASSTGSGTPAPTASSPAGGASAGIAISQAANPNEAVSETTSGAPQHRAGKVRNPFKQPPSAKAASAPASSSATHASSGSSGASSSSGPSSSSGSSNSSSSSSGASTKPAKPKPPATVYHVTVQFGLAPTAPGQSAQLKSYENLERLTPLPSAKSPLVVFAGVTSPGKNATFQLVGEVILHGPASCLPSSSQCQAVGLRPGQAEQLEYLPASGSPVVYELRLVSISSTKASAARAASAFHAESSAGRDLLRRAGLSELPGLRYSTEIGVLVPSHAHAFAAHAARRR